MRIKLFKVLSWLVSVFVLVLNSIFLKSTWNCAHPASDALININFNRPEPNEEESHIIAGQGKKPELEDSDNSHTLEYAVAIPQVIWFTFRNTLDDEPNKKIAENVNATVEMYRTAWNNTDAPTHFLTNIECKFVIEVGYPKLLKWFLGEEKGQIKGDICRTVLLYVHGGYYFDVDIKPLEPFIPTSPSTSFVSVISCGGSCLFQAFFACTAYHPVLLRTLEFMVRHYEHGGQGNMLGPKMMGNALRDVYGSGWANHTEFEFLEEIRLDVGENRTIYPDVERQNIGNVGNLCNYAVHHPGRKVIYFFSRFVGYGRCRNKGI